MIKIINKNKEDIIDIFTGEIGQIKSIRYCSSANPSFFITPITRVVKDTIEVRIPTSELSKLSEGQLYCHIEIETDDSLFPDTKNNSLITEGLKVWIQ